MNKTDESVFKTMIRGVVREEVRSEGKLLKEELIEEFVKKVDTLFAKYRDETLTKVDKLVGEVIKHNQEDALHTGQHEDFEERLEEVEKKAHQHAQ